MTTKTLTITRSSRSLYGNTANQTTSVFTVPTTGALAIRKRFGTDKNLRDPASYERFLISQITGFTFASDASGTNITVAVTYPDGSHSVIVPLCLTSNGKDQVVSGYPSLIVTATTGGPTFYVWDDAVDIDTATAITLA